MTKPRCSAAIQAETFESRNSGNYDIVLNEPSAFYVRENDVLKFDLSDVCLSLALPFLLGVVPCLS